MEKVVYLIDVSGVCQYLYKYLIHHRGDMAMMMWNANFICLSFCAFAYIPSFN